MRQKCDKSATKGVREQIESVHGPLAWRTVQLLMLVFRGSKIIAPLDNSAETEYNVDRNVLEAKGP